MIKTGLFLITLSCFALTGCTAPSVNPPANTEPSNQELTLVLARKIVPQETSATAMKQLLGPPNTVQSLESDPREIWIYIRAERADNRRMYAFVGRKSGLVESVTWNVFEADPEANLEVLKSKLGNPELTKSEAKWIKGDAAPDEAYFKSEKQRLTIVLRKSLNQVDRVMWH